MSGSVLHVRSHAMDGDYSQLCQAGYPVQLDTPPDCLVAMPDGVDRVRLDCNLVDLCADCLVARRAGIDNAVPCFPRPGGLAIDTGNSQVIDL